jgi:hypothetical protein
MEAPVRGGISFRSYGAPVLSVDFDGFSGPQTRLNGSRRVIPVRPIDVALAAASVCGWTPGGTPWRRLLRFASVAMEVLAHLSLPDTVPPAAPERLRAVHTTELDQTSKAELHQRLGVGLARIVARQPEIGLVDLYSLESLSRQPSAPTVTSIAGRRRPDFVASDIAGNWAVLEAKGRSSKGPMAGTRAAAVRQAKAIELIDVLNRQIPIAFRAASVARLGSTPAHVFFEDPIEADMPIRTWRVDPDALLVHYYQPARDLIELYGRDLRPVSGALSYQSAELPGGLLWLAVHRDLLRAELDDPDILKSRRADIAEEADHEQAETVQAGELDLAIGGDGLALLAPALRTDLLEQR